MLLAAAATVLQLLVAAPQGGLAFDPKDPGSPWIGVRLGGGAAVTAASGRKEAASGGGLYALFDGHQFLGDLSADLFVGSGTGLVSAGLGAYYPFLEGGVTPYLGGGLHLGWSQFGGDGAFSLLPRASAGLLLNRYARPQLRVELSWFVSLMREKGGVDQPRASGPLATVGLAL